MSKQVDLMPIEMHVSNCAFSEGGKVKVMSCSQEFWPRERALWFHIPSLLLSLKCVLISTMALIAKRLCYYISLSCHF